MVKRSLAWADVIQNALGVSATGSIKTDLLANVSNPVDTLTAARSVGDIMVYYDPTSAVVDSAQHIDIGIGVVSLEAFTAGLASMPDPSKAEYPPRGWLYTASGVTWQTTTAEGVMMHPLRFQWDIRAMRKIDKGVPFMLLVSSIAKGAGVTTLVSGRVRTLCMT